MHKTQDIQQQRQFLPMGNYLFLVFRPPTFNFNLLNYRIYVQKKKKTSRLALLFWTDTSVVCLKRRSANVLIWLQEFIAYFCQERHLVKHGRVDNSLTWCQFYWGLYAVECKIAGFLAAVWKVLPLFKCTKKYPIAMGLLFVFRRLWWTQQMFFCIIGFVT